MASQEKGDQNVEIHLEETSRPPVPAEFNPQLLGWLGAFTHPPILEGTES